MPYVLKQGCKLCPDSEAVARYLENLYGASFGAGIMKRGNNQIIYLGFESISDKYAPNDEALSEDLVKLMLSTLFEPVAFNDKILETEKKNAKERIMALMNDKRQYAAERCVEEMCKGDAYSVSKLGTIDGIDKITAEGLKAYYDNIIKSSVIDIYACGETDINKLAKKIGEYTSKLEFASASIPKTEMFVATQDVKRVTDNMDVVQGKLSMGFSTGIKPTDMEYPSLMVANSIFGGGAHSKLFANVREKLSLCYYASSTLEKNKGIMLVNAGIEFKNFEMAYNEILAQLENVKNGEISELEYKSSINAILNSLESYKDDQNSMQLFYLGQKLCGTNDDIESLKEKISKVTIADVANVFKSVKLDTVYFLAGKENV